MWAGNHMWFQSILEWPSHISQVPLTAVGDKGISQHFRADWKRELQLLPYLAQQSHRLPCKCQKCRAHSQANISGKTFSGQLRTLGSIPFTSIVSLTERTWPSAAEIPRGNSLQLYMVHHLAHKWKSAFLSFQDSELSGWDRDVSPQSQMRPTVLDSKVRKGSAALIEGLNSGDFHYHSSMEINLEMWQGMKRSQNGTAKRGIVVITESKKYVRGVMRTSQYLPGTVPRAGSVVSGLLGLLIVNYCELTMPWFIKWCASVVTRIWIELGGKIISKS